MSFAINLSSLATIKNPYIFWPQQLKKPLSL
jgi:hypothetical protein